MIRRLPAAGARLALSLLFVAIATAVVVQTRGLHPVAAALDDIRLPALVFFVAAVGCNVLAAGLRLHTLCSDTGHELPYRQSLAAVAAGGLGGAAFFQFAGQLAARSGVLRGMSFSAVVVVTLFERLIAAATSAALAFAGALYIFGHVYLDAAAGGVNFVKLVAGLLLAFSIAAWAGFGRDFSAASKRLLTRDNVRRFMRATALTLAVQVPMMAAYVVAAKAIAPATPVASLAAGSAIVMFAASVPISLAGWGIRELSAIFALGAIGLTTAQSLAVALLVGSTSLLAMGLTLALTWKRDDRVAVTSGPRESFDYFAALAWTLTCLAAVCVLFQIYVPTSSGTLLNVNLADPVAILGGCLALGDAIRHRALPRWRAPAVNALIIGITVALSFGLAIGYARIGWTQWSFVNRYAGWFVLVGYFATGALAVRVGGRHGLRVLVTTYVGATIAVALLESGLAAASFASLVHDDRIFVPGAAIAFAQNHNFFAFQILMALACGLAMLRRWRTPFLLVTIFALAICGSRSGWIAAATVVAAAVYLRCITWRELATCLAGLCGTVAILLFINKISGATTLASAIPHAQSNAERLLTITGGLKLFAAHPILGAGLGAFRNLNTLAASGIPLVIHSAPVWVLAEMGFVGFALFAIPAAVILGERFRSARQDPVAAAAVLCIVAFGVMCGPADMVYQRTFWLLMGGLLAAPLTRRA